METLLAEMVAAQHVLSKQDINVLTVELTHVKFCAEILSRLGQKHVMMEIQSMGMDVIHIVL